MAMCTDTLMRTFVRNSARTRDLDAYLAAEFGACARDRVLRTIITTAPRRPPARVTPGSRMGTWRQRFSRPSARDEVPEAGV